ncbi:MAG: GntR family transcriptional regulator [Pseudomonadota bacterium]
MSRQWDDNQPIYWQLRERTVAAILDGTLPEGEALPSVRQVAVDFQINPLTVSKAYQSLVDDSLVEKRRGVGMFVIDGARRQLLDSERDRFLNDEWPKIAARVDQLGLSVEQLLAHTDEQSAESELLDERRLENGQL